MDTLPSEILSKILSNLEAQEVKKRCRAVAKFLKRIIDDNASLGISLILKRSFCLGISNGTTLWAPTVFVIESWSPTLSVKIMGCFSRQLQGFCFTNSCTGLLLFERYEGLNSVKSKTLNPSTGKVMSIPDTKKRPRTHQVRRALTFDSSRNTYKILEVFSHHWTGENMGAAIFNSSTGVWQDCYPPKCPKHSFTSGDIVTSETGILYWHTGRNTFSRRWGEGQVIISFNPEQDKFGWIWFPFRVNCMQMLDLDGSLMISCINKTSIDVYKLVDPLTHRWNVRCCIPVTSSIRGPVEVLPYSSKEILMIRPCRDRDYTGNVTRNFEKYDVEKEEKRDLGEGTFSKRDDIQFVYFRLKLSSMEASSAVQRSS